MEKERKIIKSINALQKSLNDYKDYNQNLPTEINKNQANQLLMNSRNHRHIINEHLVELDKLIKALSPKDSVKPEENKSNPFKNPMDKFNDMFGGGGFFK